MAVCKEGAACIIASVMRTRKSKRHDGYTIPYTVQKQIQQEEQPSEFSSMFVEEFAARKARRQGVRRCPAPPRRANARARAALSQKGGEDGLLFLPRDALCAIRSYYSATSTPGSLQKLEFADLVLCFPLHSEEFGVTLRCGLILVLRRAVGYCERLAVVPDRLGDGSGFLGPAWFCRESAVEKVGAETQEAGSLLLVAAWSISQ